MDVHELCCQFGCRGRTQCASGGTHRASEATYADMRRGFHDSAGSTRRLPPRGPPRHASGRRLRHGLQQQPPHRHGKQAPQQACIEVAQPQACPARNGLLINDLLLSGFSHNDLLLNSLSHNDLLHSSLSHNELLLNHWLCNSLSHKASASTMTFAEVGGCNSRCLPQWVVATADAPSMEGFAHNDLLHLLNSLLHTQRFVTQQLVTKRYVTQRLVTQ